MTEIHNYNQIVYRVKVIARIFILYVPSVLSYMHANLSSTIYSGKVFEGENFCEFTIFCASPLKFSTRLFEGLVGQ